MKKWKFPFWITLALMFAALIRSGFEIREAIYTETSGFLYNYSFPRPFLNQLFDPLIHDWGLYQCRELSYLFDWLDAKFILFSWVHGFYHQFSLTAFLFFSLTIFVQQMFISHFFPKFGRLPAVLCSVIYLLSPAVSSFAFFRSSKHISAFIFSAVIFLTCSILHKKFRNCKFELVFTLFLLAFGTLVDRSAVFFAGSLTGMLGLFTIIRSAKENPYSPKGILNLLAGCFIIVLLAVINNLFLTPYLIFRINGYFPSLLYQQQLPPWGWGTVIGGLTFITVNIGNTFFGFSQYAALPGTVFLIAVGYLIVKRKNSVLISSCILTLCAMIICASAMYLRHPAILLPDVICGGYFKGFLAVFVLFLIHSLAALQGKIRIGLLLLLLLARIIVPSIGTAKGSSPVYQFDHHNFKLMLNAVNHGIDTRNLSIPYRDRLLTERIYFLRTNQKDHTSPGEVGISREK